MLGYTRFYAALGIRGLSGLHALSDGSGAAQPGQPEMLSVLLQRACALDRQVACLLVRRLDTTRI